MGTMSGVSGMNRPWRPSSSSGAMYLFPGWSSMRKIASVLTSMVILSLAAKGGLAGVWESLSYPFRACCSDSDGFHCDGSEGEALLLLADLDLHPWLQPG